MSISTEFEASRVLPVPREQAFAVASDLDHLDRWMPPGVHVEPVAPNVVTADGPLVPESPQEGVTGASPDQYRLEWGSRGDGRYAGWLQLAEQGQGECEATLHLSFLGDQEQAHGGRAADEVERMLAESLDRLADTVATNNR